MNRLGEEVKHKVYKEESVYSTSKVSEDHVYNTVLDLVWTSVHLTIWCQTGDVIEEVTQ